MGCIGRSSVKVKGVQKWVFFIIFDTKKNIFHINTQGSPQRSDLTLHGQQDIDKVHCPLGGQVDQCISSLNGKVTCVVFDYFFDKKVTSHPLSEGVPMHPMTWHYQGHKTHVYQKID